MQLTHLRTDYDAGNFSQGELITETLYFLATSAAKVSILMFYLRIFTGRKFRIIAWSLIIVCVQYGVGTAIATVFGCRPISAAWKYTFGEYTCINKLDLYYANTGLGIVIDFLTFVLPLWVSSNKEPTLEKGLLIYYLIIIVRSCSGFSSLGNRR